MHEIIHFNFLVFAIFASASASASARIYNCTYLPQGLVYVCGSDSKTYKNIYYLWCEQKEEYGIRVNLHLKHEWKCFIWESYGIETTTILCVS